MLIQSRTFTELVEGQILETVEPGPGEDPLAHYLEVVAGKTGSLIATSAEYGAMFGGASAEVRAALRGYGEIVGAAFQLSDDILDVASESTESGKTPGTDLREGVPTLPVLMARASTDPADARLLELLDSRPDRRRPARRGPRPAAQAPGHGRRPAATSLAESERAKALLTALEPGPVRTALESFADIVANRTS